MKKVLIILIIAVIIVSIVISCFVGYFIVKLYKAKVNPAPTIPVSTEPMDFEKIRLVENNCSAINSVLEVEKTEDGVRLIRAYENMSMDDERTVVREINGDKELLGEIQKTLGGYGVESWDGFRGANPPHILDGSSMSFECTMADGRELSAYGSNNFPKNYGAVYGYIFNMLYRETISSDVFEGECYKIKLPESWIGNVEVTYEETYNAFAIPLEDGQNVLLMRVDYRPYELNDKSHITSIGKIKKVDSDEELFLEVLNYESYMKEDEGTAEQYKIYSDFSEDINKIIDSIELINGYEFVEEEE